MTLSDDLNATADIIEQGWTQKCYIDEAGVCLIGGINSALNYSADDEYSFVMCPRAQAAERAVSEYIGVDEIACWNDQKGRTQAEVVQMLRDCATKNQPDTMWG